MEWAKHKNKIDTWVERHSSLSTLLLAPTRSPLALSSSQVGQRSGFDNRREFREQTFDKHDNALTALIGRWLMTDIPVARLIQNASAWARENYPTVAYNWIQEVSCKTGTRWDFFFFFFLKQGFIRKHYRDDGWDAAAWSKMTTRKSF